MRRAAWSLIAFALLCPALAQAQAQRLVVLSPTGEVRDGLPVLEAHPDAAGVHATLSRGFSGRLLRLYALEQEFLRRRTGRTPEPAYLLLSDRQGGFPQFGFYLGNEKKADAGWVDLHRSSRPSGQFGAMDQIFPHELLHVIVRQLAGEPRRSGGNQMHAVGVRTDPVNAFNEGFAEHVQILAIDDADAVEDTRTLRHDADARARADRELAAFARDLGSSWRPVQPSRLRFLLWFSQTEQVLRYHAVKANLFARAPAMPSRLLDRQDKYGAYLFQSILPGAPDGAIEPAAVALSTDGPVGHLFWRLVSDPAIQQRYQDPAFYGQFGVATGDVAPLENVYLKLFVALAESRPATTVELLRGYVRAFPEEAPDVARVVNEALLGQDLPHAPEIWLANDALVTGTSLFDQFRTLPRPHTFDVNAATRLDWLSVPGITPDAASRLLAGAPYASLDDVLAAPGVSPSLRDRIRTMSAAMTELTEGAEEREEALSLWAIARAYLWRLGVLILLAASAGTALARYAGARRWWTAAFIALAATLLVAALAWVVIAPPWYPLAAPAIAGGAPWAAWRLVTRQSIRRAAAAFGVWAAASLPALGLFQAPLFL